MITRIQGQDVRSYAYTWIDGGCPIHQWASGGKGIDRGLITYVKKLLSDIANNRGTWADKSKPGPYTNHHPNNLPVHINGLTALLRYLIKHEGEPATPYEPGYDDREAMQFAEYREGLEREAFEKGCPLPGTRA
jgi:hypothetical protein